jgi:DNA repair exonuclease SbcCD ATPase subunit
MELEEIKTTEKVSIPRDAKVKVYWQDTPENYSKDGKLRVRDAFAQKYGVAKGNIQVIYEAIKRNEETGEVIEIDGATIDNIMDNNYQKSLMKEWVEREGVDIEFERLMDLDNKVNSQLDSEFLQNRSNKRWSIKWLKIDNFLAFGEDNYVSMSNINGLVVVNSLPKNQGGKTTFSVDTIKFLIFGNTTKTEKNEQIFNQYSNKNDVMVKGMIEIDGQEIVIERKLTRTAKRKGGWNVKGSLDYYNVLPDGEYEKQNEEHAGETTKKIKETIGLESDFEMVVLATARNIDDVIDQTTTESGKLLTRFIGLEVIAHKEAIVRKMFNEFNKKLKSNLYSTPELEEEIKGLKEDISSNENLLAQKELELVEVKAEYDNKVGEKEGLINSKLKVDVNISSLDPTKLENALQAVITEGNTVKAKIAEYETQIKAYGTIDFDEDRHDEVTKEISKLNTEIAVDETNVANHKTTIKMLEDGQICNTCNRPLDDVDNTDEIAKNDEKIKTIQHNIGIKERKLDTLNEELNSLNTVKKEYDEKNKLELKRDRAEVEIDNLRNKVRDIQGDIKKYNDNLDAINTNIEIDSKIEKVKADIGVIEYNKDTLVSNIQILKNKISNNEKDILTKEKLIRDIAKEEEIGKIFKIYIDMIGKKGITKLVLRSVLPILNSEVQRLLDEACDFDVEIFMDDKNEVRYLLVKDGVEKPLKSASGLERTISSLAIRVVLGKMSALPMPNFITFDEVMGRVAAENVMKMEPLFQKIKDMFDVVFFITHDDMVKDWADTIITVKKTNNISKLCVN